MSGVPAAPDTGAAPGRPAEAAPPQVRAGFVVALRLMDVAYAIDLKRAEALWSAEAGRASSRGRLRTAEPKALAFGVPPVVIALDAVPLELPGLGAEEAFATARLYDFGAIAFELRIPVTGEAWGGFAALVDAVDAALGPAADTPVWSGLLARLRPVLETALVRPTPSAIEEDYLIAIVHEFDVALDAAAIERRLDLAALLSGETRALSEQARADLLRHRFSYYRDDLVVLGWDRAFIYEPRRDTDVADVLEVANAQLLELRYYDELLDAELPRMYQLVAASRRGANLRAARRYARLARRLYTLVAEVTELTERVDNALQVTEDVYLARVYAAALDLFRVPAVAAAVDRKLSIIRDTYAALYEEASSSRAELLEIAIVLLIVIEIALAVWRP